MRSIALLKQLIADEGRPGHTYRNPLFQRVDALRVHLIDGGSSLTPLGAGSKTTTHWAFLSQLHDLGVKAADSWLAQHGDAIGVRSSLDLSGLLAS
jgi:NTE family protein